MLVNKQKTSIKKWTMKKSIKTQINLKKIQIKFYKNKQLNKIKH